MITFLLRLHLAAIYFLIDLFPWNGETDADLLDHVLLIRAEHGERYTLVTDEEHIAILSAYLDHSHSYRDQG